LVELFNGRFAITERANTRKAKMIAIPETRKYG
jgi:hypothetical protein